MSTKPFIHEKSIIGMSAAQLKEQRQARAEGRLISAIMPPAEKPAPVTQAQPKACTVEALVMPTMNFGEEEASKPTANKAKGVEPLLLPSTL